MLEINNRKKEKRILVLGLGNVYTSTRYSTAKKYRIKKDDGLLSTVTVGLVISNEDLSTLVTTKLYS